ncbi:MAG: hypothetical protein Q8L22_30910, partial [Reyranella sp.]|nr:hypothetical protein [Reyranella sp.]
MIVVEPALTRFVVALAALVRTRGIAPAYRLGDFTARRLKSAGGRGAGEIGASVTHRATVARAGRRAAVTTTATTGTAAAISTTTAAAIATATATA